MIHAQPNILTILRRATPAVMRIKKQTMVPFTHHTRVEYEYQATSSILLPSSSWSNSTCERARPPDPPCQSVTPRFFSARRQGRFRCLLLNLLKCTPSTFVPAKSATAQLVSIEVCGEDECVCFSVLDIQTMCTVAASSVKNMTARAANMSSHCRPRRPTVFDRTANLRTKTIMPAM